MSVYMGTAEHPSPDSVPPEGRILVIDADEVVVDAVRRALRAKDVTTLTSAADALALLRAGERFGAIISDMLMPNISGQALYEATLSLAPDQAARIVFLSGGAFTDRTQKFLASVPNARLDKPFIPSALRAVIRKTIRGNDST